MTQLTRKRQSASLKSDDGHPGRFNAWESQRIDSWLQANVEELRSIAEALTAVVERSAE